MRRRPAPSPSCHLLILNVGPTPDHAHRKTQALAARNGVTARDAVTSAGEDAGDPLREDVTFFLRVPA